jgi:hypothetical protein
LRNRIIISLHRRADDQTCCRAAISINWIPRQSFGDRAAGRANIFRLTVAISAKQELFLACSERIRGVSEGVTLIGD